MNRSSHHPKLFDELRVANFLRYKLKKGKHTNWSDINEFMLTNQSQCYKEYMNSTSIEQRIWDKEWVIGSQIARPAIIEQASPIFGFLPNAERIYMPEMTQFKTLDYYYDSLLFFIEVARIGKCVILTKIP